MDDMLRRQDEIEADCGNRLIGLDQNLVVIEDLIRQFNAYQLSYSKLLVEIARRRQYKEVAENIVRGMMVRLEAMSEGVFFFKSRMRCGREQCPRGTNIPRIIQRGAWRASSL